MYEDLKQIFLASPDLWFSRKELAKRAHCAKSPRLVTCLNLLIDIGLIEAQRIEYKGHTTWFYISRADASLVQLSLGLGFEEVSNGE